MCKADEKMKVTGAYASREETWGVLKENSIKNSKHDFYSVLHKDKMHGHLQNNNTRKKILEGNLKYSHYSNKRSFEFLKLLKIGM